MAACARTVRAADRGKVDVKVAARVRAVRAAAVAVRVDAHRVRVVARVKAEDQPEDKAAVSSQRSSLAVLLRRAALRQVRLVRDLVVPVVLAARAAVGASSAMARISAFQWSSTRRATTSSIEPTSSATAV